MNRGRNLVFLLPMMLVCPSVMAQLDGNQTSASVEGDFYRLPNEQISFHTLFRMFFAHVDSRMGHDPVTDEYWADFLASLEIKVGTAEEAALVRAALNYRVNLPTESEKRAEAEVMEALLANEAAYMARLHEVEDAKTRDLAAIVRTLDNDLREAGTTMAGVLAFIERELRPTTVVMSDKPRGADDSYFVHASTFCSEARIECNVEVVE